MEFQAIVMCLCIALLHVQMPAAVTTSAATGDIGASERDPIALLAFKFNIKYDPQGIMSSWNNSLHFCKWQGVTCGRKHRRVTILDLESKGLVGTLSPYIGNLSFLMEMRLATNTLYGQIPPEVGHLSRLKNLRLANNSFEGGIPADVFRCSNLVNLLLDNNKLSGKIPEKLGSLSKLKALSIGDNNLTGGIPPFIGNLTSLERFSARFNNFGGSIPDAFNRLINLKQLGLAENELSGNVPPSLYNLSLLTVLSLGGNQLHGQLPQNIGLIFPQLQFLQLRQNLFTGPIPHSLSNASKLVFIELGSNNFAGKVSVDFRGMNHLESMSIHTNNLGTGGANDLKFVPSLLNCSSLVRMNIAGNRFGGAFPNSIGNISSPIKFLRILYNQISGRIPSWIDTLTNITVLEMSNNQFIGSIPDTLGKLQKLTQIDLSFNRLSGKIPPSVGNLSSLIELYLDNNRFEGSIPSSLGKCRKLLDVNLSQNSLNGTIPKQLFDIFALSISLSLAQNRLVGFLEVGNLINLEELDVSENELFGEIPKSLGYCRSLVNLNMRGNFFNGSIPQSLSSLGGAQRIDLSHNNLSGQIPNFLEKFSLTYLNLSFNEFEGELPSKGVFANTTALSVFGNKRLCGGISELKLPICSTKEAKKGSISSLGIIFITLACVLLGVTVVSSFVYFRFKKKRKEHPFGSLLEKSLVKVSYAMLLKATNDFSMANLIGVGSFGSVYKGILDHHDEEQIVAIKVFNLQRRGASKSFMAECEALRNIRHRNLLKIITSCSSLDFQGNDFKALVYEFMPNGSLEKWLHPIPETITTITNQDQLQNLNLLQRISISIDVAYAIDYIHHHCQPPIVHCDLKPSNILLDTDMIAHVGDFGLAKLLQEFTNSNQSSSTGVRGTIGYAAPEYGLGSEVSTSGDVYSFGIVLLEMITGKKPTDGEFEEGHNLHNLARLALPDGVMEIVDPVFLSNEGEATAKNIKNPRQARNGNKTEESLIALVKIGVACSMESPQDRMDITNVVRELHLARDILQ